MKRKVLAVGIILLFVGVTVVHSINANMPISDDMISGTGASNFTADLGTLSGYVTDSMMNPIEAARVRVYFHDTYRENYSNVTGYFHVTDISICNCTKNATCSKEGYNPAWVYLSIWENTTYDFVLTSKGNWLYVGGSEPGNYTRIQDAIDNASNGDIVFVFNGLYYENVRVNKSITLFGENQTATVIDGQEQNGHIITIVVAGVTVYGFTIRNCGGISNAAEIYVTSDDNQIIENIVTCTSLESEEGIWLWQSSGTTISRNTITNHYVGIWLENCTNNNITHNHISTVWEWGIVLGKSERNSIYENIVTNNKGGGIYLRDSSENMLSGNNITKNTRGVALVESVSTSSNNTILKNNFMKNKGSDASFMLAKKSHTKNLWEGNYWNRPLRFPKLILGGKEFFFIPGIPFHFPGIVISLPWFNFDWRPAKEPYDIGV
jgi:parallel beta-helix repeat protein